jgi:uncharacterized protein YjiS (DUF1127 family)
MSSIMMQSTLSTGRTVAKPIARRGLTLRLLESWFGMLAKQRSRRQLAELDTRLLRDIGIDRASAYEEARRSVWQ